MTSLSGALPVPLAIVGSFFRSVALVTSGMPDRALDPFGAADAVGMVGAGAVPLPAVSEADCEPVLSWLAVDELSLLSLPQADSSRPELSRRTANRLAGA